MSDNETRQSVEKRIFDGISKGLTPDELFEDLGWTWIKMSADRIPKRYRDMILAEYPTCIERSIERAKQATKIIDEELGAGTAHRWMIHYARRSSLPIEEKRRDHLFMYRGLSRGEQMQLARLLTLISDIWDAVQDIHAFSASGGVDYLPPDLYEALVQAKIRDDAEEGIWPVESAIAEIQSDQVRKVAESFFWTMTLQELLELEPPDESTLARWDMTKLDWITAISAAENDKRRCDAQA